MVQEIHPLLTLTSDYNVNTMPPGQKPVLVNITVHLHRVVSINELQQVNIYILFLKWFFKLFSNTLYMPASQFDLHSGAECNTFISNVDPNIAYPGAFAGNIGVNVQNVLHWAPTLVLHSAPEITQLACRILDFYFPYRWNGLTQESNWTWLVWIWPPNRWMDPH